MNKYPPMMRDMIRCRKLFARLYGTELVGISDDYIHITRPYFAKIANKFQADIKVLNISNGKYPTSFETSFVINGEKFLAIGTPEEFKAVGIDVEA